MATRKLYNYPQGYAQTDLSGAVQVGTSHLLRKRNEVTSAKNADFNKKIGSAVRRKGYEKVARTIQQGNDSLYGGVYKYGSNFKIVTGINNQTNTAAELRVMDTADYWTTILTTAVNTRFQCLNFFDEFYVAGLNDSNQYQTLTNIDSTLVPSTSRNVYKAPACKYIADYQGTLYAMNCQVNGVTYKNRIYPSSPAIGPITFIQTDQKGLLLQLRVDATTYLKVGMQIDIYGKGSENKKVSGLTVISVDKKNKRFSFASTTIDVSDNDEIWLTGRKGKLNTFWNTDDPTPQEAEYFDLAPGKEADPEITGWTKNNNRIFFFTKNSCYRHDGANMILISDTVGCVSHETIQNIGSWSIWLHSTGVWGYNDNTGQLKQLSRAIQPYIQAINQTNFPKSSAGVVGRVYKLAVGEIATLDTVTTSTSTSSTSTSSTSSSTSSTSTSSTSTSSTSTSTTTITTSTSSTSSSTSSTSISTTSVSTSSTSTSLSTSTSSTTTTTLASSKKVIRLDYDFDMNAWWIEEHKREIRFQFNHTMNGYTKPYFTDETGRLFRDETGDLDHEDTIPFEVEIGRDNMGTDQVKGFLSVLVDSEKATGAKLQYSLDGGNFETLGSITSNIQKMVFPQRIQKAEGRDIDYKFVHNDRGEAPVINGLTTFKNLAEMFVTENT